MTAIPYPSAYNGAPTHYFVTGEPCHSAVLAGNLVVTDGLFTSADIIQIDAVNALNVIVPLRRNGVGCDRTYTTTNTFHLQADCTRDF